jgi:hypothetical protein
VVRASELTGSDSHPLFTNLQKGFDSPSLVVTFFSYRYAMKKLALFLATAALAATSAHAAIIFNPANPFSAVDEGGFTGTSTVGANPYSQARVLFSFSGLNPDPLPSSFQISNISLEGPGISTSLSFADVTVSANGFALTGWVNLDSTLSTVDLVGSLVSFDLPGGNVINDGGFECLCALCFGQRVQCADLHYRPDFRGAKRRPGSDPRARHLGRSGFARWWCRLRPLAQAQKRLTRFLSFHSHPHSNVRVFFLVLSSLLR